MAGFNWFLIIIVAVVSVLVFLATAYLIIYYQHPEDKNQAWVPKVVVWLGLSLAVLSVLMFPLDVANRGACEENVPLSSCDLTLPMRGLWFGVYITNTVLVFFMTPFTLFYYEAGSDRTLAGKVCGALGWVSASAVVLGLILGIAYGLVGFVEFPTQRIQSGMGTLDNIFEPRVQCLVPDIPGENITGDVCDATKGINDEATWKLRTSFPIYVVAITSALGWVMFIVFGGIGVAALPVDLIRSFLSRPKSTITKSEYIKTAKGLAGRAREIKDLAEEIRKDERANGRTRKWKRNFKDLNRQLLILEEDHEELESKFPQGEDGETKWVLYQLSFYVKLVIGIIGLVISIIWIIHIVVYMLVDPPLTPFLNSMFISLDDAFPLFGTLAFGCFCVYLIAVTIKGHVKLGLDVGFLELYPIRPNGTMMNSMLVNTALVLLSSTAVIQFCASAFPLYAEDTAIEEIFGNDIEHLIGIKYLYRENIFLYCFLGFAFLGIILILIKGPARKKKEETYAI